MLCGARRVELLWVVAGLWGAVCGTASGVGLSTLSVVCPVCDHAFETLVYDGQDTRGGVTRDLFARALGPQSIYYLISTCPKCYFSGYLDDFQSKGRVDAALRNKILKSPKLRPATAISTTMKPDEIPAATRYALAAQVFDWRNCSEEARAWVYLRWAWVVREDGSYLPPTSALMMAMREIEPRLPAAQAGVNQGDRELEAVNLLTADWMEGSFDAALDPYVRLVLALVLRRHGENEQSGHLLGGLKGIVLAEPLPGAIAKMEASIAEERRLLFAAREHFELAVSRHEVRPENEGAAKYLLGELYRRTGDPEHARTWYEAALGDSKLDGQLRNWAQQQRAGLAIANAVGGSR